MKVLWFTNSPALYSEVLTPESIGGAWVTSIEREFRKNKIDLTIAFPTDSSFSKNEYKGSFYYGVPRYKSNSKLSRYLRRRYSLIENEEFLISQYLKVINEVNPDIIQIFGSEEGFGLVIPHVSIPCILHIQGNLTVYYQKYFNGITKDQIKRSIGIIERIKRVAPYYRWKSFEKRATREQKIFKNCNYFFGRTMWDKRITKSLSPKSKYIHCDELIRDVFYSNEWGKNDNNTFVIITVMRDNVIYKGLESIYDTARILKENNFKFEWMIVGVKNNSPILKVLRKTRNYNLSEMPIQLLGPLGTDQLLEEFLKADLLVHPSHIDNSPNSICEGMLLGMPILSTSAGGVPSLIEDNVSGYLLQDGDPWALAGAIQLINLNYHEAVKKGENARRTALQRHNKNTIFKTIIETYNSLLNNS